MLSILGRGQAVCNGLTRRAMLQVGGAGLFGLTSAKLQAAESITGQFRNGPAKSVIFVFLFGGPSQLETFDMKPDATSNLRGPFQPIDARPGLRICQHMPRLAAMSDKYAVIRSMTHQHNDHNACHYMMTGHMWTRKAENGQDVNARETDWPSIGSVVEYLSAHETTRRRTFPDYVYLPNRLGHLQIPKYDRTGQYAGWLGSAYNGLSTEIRPLNPKDNLWLHAAKEEELDFRIKGLVPTTEISLDRLDRRKSLLEQFDEARSTVDAAAARIQAYDSQRDQALDLVTSDAIRNALDIRQEKPELRDQYGRHLFGQSCLMGRRMVEAGCRFVTVAWDAVTGTDGWDSHGTSAYMEKSLIPGLDQGLSALLTDLEDRGLLDETLVVAVGEMGRTPKPDTPQWGRGHWSYCFPAVLAGAGVKGGLLLGRSDKDAAWPVERPVSPEELGATIYDSLGVGLDLVLPDRLGRPVPILEGGGQPIAELFG